MKIRSVAIIQASLAVVLALGTPDVSAQNAAAPSSPAFAQAASAYSVGDYNGCATLLSQVLASEPNNEIAHYYMALAQHSLGRTQAAGFEYQWLTQRTRDPELMRRAQMGLAALGNPPAPSYYSQPTPGYQQPGAQPGTPAATTGTTGWLSQTGAQQAQNAVAPRGPKPRIIDLYTDWCGWCKFFEPIFVQVQSKYSNQINFERMNAEAGDNRALVKKYKVTGYPTILFLDANGKLVDRINGAPQTPAEFEQRIFKAFPSLKPY